MPRAGCLESGPYSVSLVCIVWCLRWGSGGLDPVAGTLPAISPALRSSGSTFCPALLPLPLPQSKRTCLLPPDLRPLLDNWLFMISIGQGWGADFPRDLCILEEESQ